MLRTPEEKYNNWISTNLLGNDERAKAAYAAILQLSETEYAELKLLTPKQIASYKKIEGDRDLMGAVANAKLFGRYQPELPETLEELQQQLAEELQRGAKPSVATTGLESYGRLTGYAQLSVRRDDMLRLEKSIENALRDAPDQIFLQKASSFYTDLEIDPETKTERVNVDEGAIQAIYTNLAIAEQHLGKNLSLRHALTIMKERILPAESNELAP